MDDTSTRQISPENVDCSTLPARELVADLQLMCILIPLMLPGGTQEPLVY